jgi:hypothetical protein
MVNSASNVARDGMDGACCPATQTQRRPDENHLQIQHNAARLSSTRAWLFSECAMSWLASHIPTRSGNFYPAFTELKNGSAFRLKKNIRRQRLNTV